jgi:uncharacterized protein (DUF2237 family)
MTSLKGTPLQVCSLNPLTGYYRDGYCKNFPNDTGTHVVCASMTDEFLQYTKTKGNNLITPSAGFPGLKQGDKWCVCATRWEEARKANKAPPVDLAATDSSALQFNSLETYAKAQTRGGKRRKRKARKTRRRLHR